MSLDRKIKPKSSQEIGAYVLATKSGTTARSASAQASLGHFSVEEMARRTAAPKGLDRIRNARRGAGENSDIIQKIVRVENDSLDWGAPTRSVMQQTVAMPMGAYDSGLFPGGDDAGTTTTVGEPVVA